VKNSSHDNMYIESVIGKICQWHHDRNLIHGSTDSQQFLKLSEEFGELAESIAKGKPIKDDVGDIVVVLVNICERHNISLKSCLEQAYKDIRHRTGRMVDGIFIKEQEEAEAKNKKV